MRQRSNAISRRALIAGSAAVGAVSLAPSRPALAQAPSGVHMAGVHTFKVGVAEVTVLSDGALTLPVNVMLPGRETAEIETVFAKAGQAFSGLNSQINVAVIKFGAEVILVDTGGGPDFMPTLGKLGDRMQAAGFAPEAVTKVIITHGHPDHLWGVIDPLGGGTLFEKAQHLMPIVEFDFWIQSDVDARVPEAFRGMAVGTHRRLKSIAERIKPVASGSEIVSGIQFVDTSGHTPGHVSVLLRSGTEQLLIGSDALTQSVISFAAPDWRWGPDMDHDKAAASRRRILDQLATDRIRLLGYHLPWPGLGHVERRDGAFRFVAV